MSRHFYHEIHTLSFSRCELSHVMMIENPLIPLDWLVRPGFGADRRIGRNPVIWNSHSRRLAARGALPPAPVTPYLHPEGPQNIPRDLYDTRYSKDDLSQNPEPRLLSKPNSCELAVVCLSTVPLPTNYYWCSRTSGSDILAYWATPHPHLHSAVTHALAPSEYLSWSSQSRAEKNNTIHPLTSFFSCAIYQTFPYSHLYSSSSHDIGPLIDSPFLLPTSTVSLSRDSVRRNRSPPTIFPPTVIPSDKSCHRLIHHQRQRHRNQEIAWIESSRLLPSLVSLP